MRNEEAIRAEIDALITEYRAKAHDLTQRQIDAHKAKRDTLYTELSDALSKGANPCECGNKQYAPMGMVKTPAYIDRGVEMPAIYEVGCIHCSSYLVESKDGYNVVFGDGKKGKYKRRSFSARAFTIKDAVANWNAGKWVEDNLFDRNLPGISEHASQDENGVWHLP